MVAAKEQAFRYLTKQAALEYLQKQIEESPVGSVKERLIATRATISGFLE